MIRGERVELNLGSDSEGEGEGEGEGAAHGAPLPPAFVKDVFERKPTPARLPSAPVARTPNGFPEHKKRPAVSRFKQQKSNRTHHGAVPSAQTSRLPQPAAAQSSVPPSDRAGAKPNSWDEGEKARIEQENRQKIASMSLEEIEEERRELMNSLSPAFLQRLLAKSDVGSGSNEVHLCPHATHLEPPTTEQLPAKTKSSRTATFEEQPELQRVDEEERLASATPDENPTSADQPPHGTVHFPREPQPPELDPASDTFLEDLHQKYFPSLPSDPSKLEWMQSTHAKNTYDPSASLLSASDIRFSFKGNIIPPSQAKALPVTLGLHHHGDAPDAAGYTIAELAHLSRSTYPAQRCIAFQTLGRVLYRLGQGEFGDPGEPEQLLTRGTVEGPENTFGELARGLWREIERLHVVPTLVDEAEGRGVDGGKHISAKAYATEAVWLWRKGGGRRWKAG